MCCDQIDSSNYAVTCRRNTFFIGRKDGTLPLNTLGSPRHNAWQFATKTIFSSKKVVWRELQSQLSPYDKQLYLAGFTLCNSTTSQRERGRLMSVDKVIPGKTSLSRRQFVGAASLAAATSATGALASSRQGVTQISKARATGLDYDVLVIGGGFTGVTAARDVRKNGLSCAILEVRNRLGGRTYYTSQGKHKVELGGTWVHWMQPFVWSEVMRYGLEVQETPGAAAERIIEIRDGKAFQPELDTLYRDLLAGGQPLMASAKTTWPRPFDHGFSREAILAADGDSIDELLQSTAMSDSQRTLYRRLLGSAANAPISEISANEALRIFALCANNIETYYDVHARYKLKDGTLALIEKMIEDGQPEVKLNTYVKRIEQQDDRVIVTSITGEKFSASHLVCTTPLNVLKDIEFSPALHPDMLAASREGHAGQGFKLYAEIRGRIPNVQLLGEEGDLIQEAFAYHIGEESSLIACFGSDSDTAAQLDNDSLQTALRRFLPDIEVVGSASYGWTNDPFAKGTWCLWRPNWYQRYGDGLKEGAQGRVHFASSDYCEGTRGYIDGAIGSGARAAARIHQAMGR